MHACRQAVIVGDDSSILFKKIIKTDTYSQILPFYRFSNSADLWGTTVRQLVNSQQERGVGFNEIYSAITRN